VRAARCFQAAFLERLRPQLGELVGYKVGLFSKAGQDRYGADGPVLGRLYSKMLLPDGATVRADYGAAPAWESDLLVVVGDTSINTASSRQELYRALRSVRPFIELGNGNYEASVKVNALQLEALDVGARLGVVGREIRLAPGEQGLADFLNLSVETSVKNGEAVTVDRARAPTSLGDLIEVVRFARDALVAQGAALKPGDVISLGVFTPSKAPRPGDTVKVIYGLGGSAGEATVTFK
jgi:2-keto-4-pentenoate hydratase